MGILVVLEGFSEFEGVNIVVSIGPDMSGSQAVLHPHVSMSYTLALPLVITKSPLSRPRKSSRGSKQPRRKTYRQSGCLIVTITRMTIQTGAKQASKSASTNLQRDNHQLWSIRLLYCFQVLAYLYQSPHQNRSRSYNYHNVTITVSKPQANPKHKHTPRRLRWTRPPRIARRPPHQIAPLH